MRAEIFELMPLLLVYCYHEMTAQLSEEVPVNGQKDSLQRGGTPEDVANAALFLASDLSSYITKANLSGRWRNDLNKTKFNFKKWRNSMAKKVVITGMGIISPMGHNVEEYWQGLMKEKVGYRVLVNMTPTKLRSPVKIAAEVKF